jgi:membrane fusion protein, copper/silver efflux system
MKTIKQYFQSGKTPLMIAIAVLLGIGIGYGFRSDDTTAGTPEPHQHVSETSPQPDSHEEQILYICPMNCVPPMEKPGNCPVCGMELMPSPTTESPESPSENVIRFLPEAEKTAGIQVAPAERKMVDAEIRLFGKIEYDPVEQYKVTAFAPGIIDRIYIKRAGQTVRRGTPLFDIHSSELFFLEQELFELLKLFPDAVDYRPARGQTYKRLMRPARRSLKPAGESGEYTDEQKTAMEKIEQVKRKMHLLGLSDDDIENVMAKGRPSGITTVTTPTTGIVLEQYAFKGTYVNTGETIFTIANPRYMWARLDAYESDFPWIRLGQEAEFETDAYPGEIFKGQVLYLDPFFDKNTRTFKVGVLYQDQHLRFKPNMLVRCRILVRLTADGVSESETGAKDKLPLVIPESAPLITGTRAIVYVAHPEETGIYEAREIMLGPRARGYYVVKQGLEEGEDVVVNGNFKIDSAVQILAKSSMMGYKGGEPITGHHQLGTPPLMDLDKEMDMDMNKKMRPEMPSNRTVPRHPLHNQSED